jgi:segregation and condensation protein A
MQTMAEQFEPVARVGGEVLTILPEDLYIPPDALKVFLEAFEGPLDLLLYLIKRQNLDILNIPVAQITAQYMQYIDLMQDLQLELAAEYLLMAAILAEIKSRMLLPKPEGLSEEEDDPRAELMRRLQEYEQIKQAAENLDKLPRLERDLFLAQIAPPLLQPRALPEVDLEELLSAFKEVMQRVEITASHQIQRETLSIRERMSYILAQLQTDQFSEFKNFFTLTEGRLGVVVTFIAILELLKQAMVEMVQTEAFAPIYLKAC